LIAHDYYPFCVAIYLNYGGPCTSCDANRLTDCLKNNPRHRFFNGVTAEDWLALRQAFVRTLLEQALPIVTPSRFVAQRWQTLMPALPASRFRLVEHGIDMPAPVAYVPPQEELRVLVLSRMYPEKGSELIRQILPDISGFARLILLGCGDEAGDLTRHPGVTAVPHYSHDELPALIAQLRPHMGMQLSTFPETFCYTLSEMWHFGLPVLATRIGSLEERVREGETGFLVDAEPSAIVSRLRELATQLERLARLRARLLETPSRTLEAMLEDYRELLGDHEQHLISSSTRPCPPRVSLQPVSPASTVTRRDALYVDPQFTWKQAALAFVQYTRRKAAHSSRLPHWFRRWL
jgi:glycosyltransferase involved in cell wall biosynthesis